MTDIARAAGVGRVTLYAHFPSRAAVLDAALDRAFVEANAVLDSQVDDSQPADQTLRALIRSSWQLLDRYRRLLQAAQRDLDAEDLRRHHDTALARVEMLLTRGQAEGTFRTDLPLGWLVTTFYSLVHAAADDVNAGRLDPADAAPVLEATLLSALRPSSDPR